MNEAFKSAGFNDESPLNPADLLRLQWLELLKIHLPVFEKDSIWRYSRLRLENDREQGWKLHVSATILNASAVLQAVAPFLKSRKVFYKAPVSLDELKKLNAGIYYGYAQIGKFLTIYPQTDEESVELAERLHLLTGEFATPSIPFETRLKSRSSVYYRYGAFKVNMLTGKDGGKILAIKDQNGNLIPDLRESYENYPNWVKNPFAETQEKALKESSPLKTRFKIFRALTQRGKGGVYQGIDLETKPPRLCLVKEGRKDGETEWDGRDGFWRVNHEAVVLKNLRFNGVNVPEIYTDFVAELNFYLVTEFIEGENLHVYLKKRRRRLTVSKALNLAVQLAEIIRCIHRTGWLWRDCKPENLLMTKDGELRPVDFEGACSIEKPDKVGWTTLKSFAENERENFYNQTSETVDLYALGAIIYLLFEAELPLPEQKSDFNFSRKNIPPEVCDLIVKLLNPQTAKNLTAAEVEKVLKKAQAEIESRRIKN